MVITQSMIWEELQEQKRMLKQILQKEVMENSIEEISLNKAARLLHLGPDKVLQFVKQGKLKARTYKDSTTKKTRYRFRVFDIKEFQQNGRYEHISLHAEEFETAEQIAERVFGKNKIKKS